MTTPTELRALLAEAKEDVELQLARMVNDEKHAIYSHTDISNQRRLLARITAALSEKDDGGWLTPAAGSTIGPAVIPTNEAADAFWQYWRENGETHKHGYYESTWGAINAAIRMAGVTNHDYLKPLPPLPERKV